MIPNEGQYFQYSICMFCMEGENTIELLNEWSISGFRSQFKLEKSFKGTFFNTQVNISSMGKWERQKRLMIEIRSIISKYLHAKFNLIEVPDEDSFCIRISKNGTRGMVNYLLSGDSEMISTTCYGDLKTFTYVDLSSVVEQRFNIMISVKPPKGLVWYSLFKPFDIFTWLLLIIHISSINKYYPLLSK